LQVIVITQVANGWPVSERAGAVEAPGKVGPGGVEAVERGAVRGVGEERNPVELVGGGVHEDGLAVRATGGEE